MYTFQSGETNLFSEVAVNNVTLDTMDKDDVFVKKEGLAVSVCGSSLEYTDDGEIELEKNFKYNTTSKEVIGGDLYESQVQQVRPHQRPHLMVMQQLDIVSFTVGSWNRSSQEVGTDLVKKLEPI
uniref:Toll/interleukin-1 receptor (TIR) domain-containing protein n=1 Tax=Tanacetum cinerariifolium TaxID=118510 RepID=A0A699IGH8_TANCI|nr:Toll/interleukin-1 receptor (TIR) domain-containing protein [Tanacetum cinerariifolium]